MPKARRQGLPARAAVDRTGDMFIVTGDGFLETEVARALQDRENICKELRVDEATILDKGTQAPLSYGRVVRRENRGW